MQRGIMPASSLNDIHVHVEMKLQYMYYYINVLLFKIKNLPTDK